MTVVGLGDRQSTDRQSAIKVVTMEQKPQQQISIGVKIFGIAVSMLGLLLVVVYVSSNRLRRVSEEIGDMADYIIPLTNRVAAVDIHALEQEVLFERMLKHYEIEPVDEKLIAEELAEFGDRSEEVEREFKEIDELAQKALNHISDGETREGLAELLKQLKAVEEEHGRFQGQANEIIDLLEGGEDVDKAELTRREKELAIEEAKFNEGIERILLDFEEFTVAAAQRGQSHQATVQQLSVSISVLATVIGAVFAWFVTLGLVRPVRQLTNKMGELQEGDFTVQAQTSSRDELATLAASFNHMVGELKLKAALEETFGKYVDRRVVERLLTDATEATTEGDRQVMTVGFADVVGLGKVLENLPPQQRVELANKYFTLLAAPVTEQLGTLDKFIGTTVMAFWGPPFSGEDDHGELACAAALAQRSRLDTITEWARSYSSQSGDQTLAVKLPKLQLCIGLSTGSLVVGNIGSETAKSYTVMGDTVNTASRLKGVSKQYGVEIVLVDATVAMLSDRFITRELDLLQVVGKDEPVRVYELVGEAGAVERSHLERCETFATGLAAYRKQDWTQAQAAFEKCQEEGDPPAQLYLDRIATLKQNPPPEDWDGVWRLTRK
ncbi:MAG: adenylate/guanylate cyclase domain-containing protein [Cyanophyceae cyanobacterium]